MIQRYRSPVEELPFVEGKAEIVQGEIVRMSPGGGIHGWAAGVNLWDVDPRDEVIRSYRATDANTPQLFHFDDVADAEPAVTGWRFPVKRLKRR